MNLARSLYIRINHLRIRNKNISIISNNCIGAAIAGSCRLCYNSPTVNLQIMPEDYVEFCVNLKDYLSEDLIEVGSFSKCELEKVEKLYGITPEQCGFPFGKIGGVLIAFQHYKSFEDALDCWNRRKQRVFSADIIKHVFIVDERYKKEAEEFDKADLTGSLLFTNNFDYHSYNVQTRRVDTPSGVHFMKQNGMVKSYYEKAYNVVKYLNS